MTQQEFIFSLSACKVRQESEERAAMVILTFIYTNPWKFNLHKTDEDTRSDFLLWMYPRFRLLYRRADEERNFITYLQSAVTWTFKTWVRKTYTETAHELALRQCVYTEDQYTVSSEVAEEEPSYLGQVSPVRARQILVLALKSGVFLKDQHIRILTAVTGYSMESIYALIDELEPEIKRKREILSIYIEIKNAYFVRCARYLYQLKNLEQGTARYITLYRQYIRCTQKWKNSARRILNLPLTVSSQKIADAMGIKRSTVESSLKYLRKREYQSGF